MGSGVSKKTHLFKGCCYMCASSKGKVKQAGQARRQPFGTLKLVGRRRRVKRHDIGDNGD